MQCTGNRGAVNKQADPCWIKKGKPSCECVETRVIHNNINAIVIHDSFKRMALAAWERENQLYYFVEAIGYFTTLFFFSKRHCLAIGIH